MHKVKYGLFFDNHTQIENPDVGKNFDPEFFTDQLKRCGVDYLGFHARCNMGLAYYDTKIGNRHPSLQYDLFGKVADCCKKKDIALVAYFNGGLSTMELVNHREWQTVKPADKTYWGMVTPDALSVCYNSSFRAHIISMIREVAENYPVQGFFIDCVLSFGCVCPTCVKMMQQRSLDPNKKDDVAKFSTESALSFCKDIHDTVKSLLPEAMLFFNGPGDGPGRDFDTFFDCECLPTGSWGYEYLPIKAHSLRNITPERQVLNMTGRFYDWGDFGGLRTADSLKFDLAYGLAHGMRPNIGGHVHPRGDKDIAVFDRIAEVYHDLQQYDRFYENAVNQADIAVVFSSANEKLTADTTVQSCVRMLDELKMQFDIVFADCDKDWSQYKLFILPENMPLSDELRKRIREELKQGKALFACGADTAQSFGSELGIKYVSDSGFNPVYFQLAEKFAENIPDMFYSLYAPAVRAELNGAECGSYLVNPYYNLGWAGTHPIFYAPPQEKTEMPFITENGKCIWCAGGLFSGYAKRGALHLREVFKNIINALLPQPLIRVNKLPSCSRFAVTEQCDAVNVHITAFAPERRINTNVVEDALAVLNGSFDILINADDIEGVYLAPDMTAVEYTAKGQYIEIKLPPFEGYALVTLKKKSK